MSLWTDIQSIFRRGNNLSRLVYINVAIFVAIILVNIVAFLFSNPMISEGAINLLAVPSSLPVLLRRPWTIITYMFTHEGFWHILFNMLWLLWFGRIFSEFINQRDLVSTYILGGMCGAILYIVSFNVFPAFSESVDTTVALGASAAVMSIVFAISCYVPNYELNLVIFGKVKLIWIAIIVLALTSLIDFSSNTGGKIAHIGGALYGYYFALNLKKGRTIGIWVNKVIDTCVTLFKPRPKVKVSYKKPRTDYEYNSQKVANQAEIDKILEKISKGGYDCLTKEEKEKLFKESQNK